MKATYDWGWQIANMGFKAIDCYHMTSEELDKRYYVNEFLDPSVREAKCGWHGICYAVCDINGEDRTEFVLMFAEANDFYSRRFDGKSTGYDTKWKLTGIRVHEAEFDS